MANILAVGIATLDIVNTVEHYPEQDSEVRAISQIQRRGGNATNTLAVLSQLGHQCHWAGVLVQHPDSQVITENLKHHQINTESCQIQHTGKMPTSYITLAQNTGSRTIVHVRDCPEYDFDQFKKINLESFDWVHFEGRNVVETTKMLQHLKHISPDIPCSIEIEKNRSNIRALLGHADIHFFSKDYAKDKGYNDPISFLESLISQNIFPATITWGEQGSWGIDHHQNVCHHQPNPQLDIVDTIGAGDTFNAAMIDQLLQNSQLEQALSYSTTLASLKCTQNGLDSLTLPRY